MLRWFHTLIRYPIRYSLLWFSLGIHPIRYSLSYTSQIHGLKMNLHNFSFLRLRFFYNIKQIINFRISVHACVRVFVRARARVCVCVCACVIPIIKMNNFTPFRVPGSGPSYIAALLLSAPTLTLTHTLSPARSRSLSHALTLIHLSNTLKLSLYYTLKHIPSFHIYITLHCIIVSDGILIYLTVAYTDSLCTTV